MAFMGFGWGLVALGAVPLLVGIYWLRNRFRQQEVSSLMLWVEERQPRQGGRRWSRLQTPLVFFLELVALLGLAWAAVQPMLRSGEGVRSYLIILDDSYSMQAGGAESARARGIEALERELLGEGRYVARFILAGSEPVLAGGAVTNVGEAREAMGQWTCMAPRANIEDALALARKVGSGLAHVLVVSDEGPGHEIEAGTVRWWALGERRGNVAFVNATRSRAERGQRCLLEVANYSDGRVRRELTIERGGQVERQELELGAGQSQRLVFEVGPEVGAVWARLGGDELGIDDEVVLAAVSERPVRVAVEVGDEELEDAIVGALEATGRALVTGRGAELLVTDGAAGVATAERWVVRVVAEEPAEAYVGPFVVDRMHPLMEGVSLAGVVWAAGSEGELTGRPIVMAGNVGLVAEQERADGGRELVVRLRPEMSTVTESAGWPVLWWNVLSYRQMAAAGMAQENLRLGTDAVVRLGRGVEEVELVGPGGREELAAGQERQVIRPGAVGLYEVVAGEERYSFAVNAVSPEESDLRGASSGRWGDWRDDETVRREYRSAGWMGLLAAAVLLVGHLAVVSRHGSGKGGAV